MALPLPSWHTRWSVSCLTAWPKSSCSEQESIAWRRCTSPSTWSAGEARSPSVGVYGGQADPLPMLTMFDKQVKLRMGQANVKRWVDDILPLADR